MNPENKELSDIYKQQEKIRQDLKLTKESLRSKVETNYTKTATRIFDWKIKTLNEIDENYNAVYMYLHEQKEELYTKVDELYMDLERDVENSKHSEVAKIDQEFDKLDKAMSSAADAMLHTMKTVAVKLKQSQDKNKDKYKHSYSKLIKQDEATSSEENSDIETSEVKNSYRKNWDIETSDTEDSYTENSDIENSDTDISDTENSDVEPCKDLLIPENSYTEDSDNSDFKPYENWYNPKSRGLASTKRKLSSDKNTKGLKRLKNQVKYFTNLHGTYRIKNATQDKKVCDIRSMCFNNNGELIMVDCANGFIKTFDKDFHIMPLYKSDMRAHETLSLYLRSVRNTEVIHCLNEPERIWSICYHGQNTFALAGESGTIETFSTDFKNYFDYENSLKCGLHNWAIVSNKPYLSILSENKKFPHYRLRTFSNDLGFVTDCELIGQYMCFNQKHNTLYVTRGEHSHKSNSVYVYDYNNGWVKLCTELTSPELDTPCGVIVDKHDRVMVCGYGSENIVQFSPDGTSLGVLLELPEDLVRPKALGYDRTYHRLVVAGHADIIKVYDLV